MTLIRIALLVIVLTPGLIRTAAAFDGTTWRSLSPELRRGYVNGVVDSWDNFLKLYEYALSRNPSGAKTVSPLDNMFLDVSRCIQRRKLNYDQIYDAVAKYVEARPDRRQYSMAGLTWNAITEICKK